MNVRSLPKRFQWKPQLSPWSVLLVSVLVATAGAASIYQLNQVVERNNQTKLLLAEMKGQLSRLNSLEWEGIAKQKIDANLAEELVENQEATEQVFEVLQRLQRADSDDRLSRLLMSYQSYKATVDRALEIIASQDPAQIAAVSEDEIDRQYDKFYAEISDVEKLYEAQRDHARSSADLGTALSLAVSAVVISGLFWRFSRALWIKNQDLAVAFRELQQTQNQLVQQEKMAALGQLIAGVAHEINNPLGAIQASADNTYKALQEALGDLPQLSQRLSPEQQTVFFELIDRAVQQQSSPSFNESRSIKRELVAQLKTYGVDNTRYMADLLIDMNAYQESDVATLQPLLKDVHAEWTVQLAYNLTCAFINTQIILKSVDRSSKIVFALKNYARFDQTGQKRPLQIVDGLQTVTDLYHNKLKHNIELIRDYQPVPDIWGYPDELVQVWTNLIHNAIQAMHGKGTLKLATRQQQNGIEVTVSDSGDGISLDLQQRIFEPFFTTKTSGEGSGLGLYISQKIVDKHQGRMTVESQPGSTQFKVWLPIGSV